jgi:O-antigen/teichoic acid export membrane protein
MEALGVFVLAVTTFWLLAGIPNSLVWTPYTSRAPRMSPARRAGYAGSVTGHMAVITTVIAASLVVAALAPASWFGGNDWFATMCIALVPFSVMMMLREHVRRICLTHLHTSDLLMIDVPIGAIQILFMLLLAKWNLLTATTALLAIGLSCSAAAIWLVRHRHEFQWQRRRVGVHWSYNLQFGRWLLAVSLAWLLGDSAYRWIVTGSTQLASSRPLKPP